MTSSPFEHGLSLAWSDGALSRRGAQLLELLQVRLNLNDSERSIIEEKWLKSLANLNRRSFGDGDETLANWLVALKDVENLEVATRNLGRTALEIGLSKSIWKDAYVFAKGLGLGDAFAKGTWMENDAQAINKWPEALDPLAIIIGAGITKITHELRSADSKNNVPVIIINNHNKKAHSLDWLPNLEPLSEGCQWCWKEKRDVDLNIPDGDLIISVSVIEEWIKRLITQRIERGDKPLQGLPQDASLVTSSISVRNHENNLHFEMILDLNKIGLVKPWAQIIIKENGPTARNAPKDLDKTWAILHDGMAELVMNGIESLPRQLLISAEIGKVPIRIELIGEWLKIDLAEL